MLTNDNTLLPPIPHPLPSLPSSSSSSSSSSAHEDGGHAHLRPRDRLLSGVRAAGTADASHRPVSQQPQRPDRSVHGDPAMDPGPAGPGLHAGGHLDQVHEPYETPANGCTDASVHHRQKTLVTDMCYPAEISSLMDFGSPDCSLGKVLLHEEVAQLQEEVQLLRQMKDMLGKDLQDQSQGGGGGGTTTGLLSAAELRAQLGDKEQELDRAKEALQAMKADRKRLKGEKGDLTSQMQQLYTTLESREDQLREFIRNYDQHRKESEDAVKVLAREKDVLEREKWDLRRQTKEATEQANILRSQLDMKENRIKELEAELTMAKQSLATLTKDVPKRHSLASTTEPMVNGSQEWVMQADLPLTAAIRQSQQTLYHGHNADRQAVVKISPCHSRQPSVISDASAADGDRSSTPSDINSPRHRTHSLCNSMEDLEDQKRKKKKEKMTLGSLSRVFARGKQRKSLDPGLFDDMQQQSLADGDEQLDHLQQAALTRTTCMSLWRAGTVQAWLEVVMGMPTYTRACSENVKSGKVLLALTDEDLEVGLGVGNTMHRRKLRLAIEDYRRAEGDQGNLYHCPGLSKASNVDHHWVSTSWLSDVGLPQYSPSFQAQLVDGRVLSSLCRRDLERFLDVSDPFHQTSLLLSAQLLQTLGFDKELLRARRAKCEQQDLDPVVWTCRRVMKWIRDVDLKEFADNLQGKGINGAVLVLDASFDLDAMAKALEIPGNKHVLRRRLYEEMKTLAAASSNKAPEGEAVASPTPVAVSRFAEGRVPLRRSSKSPLRLRAHSAERRVSLLHGSFRGSLPKEAGSAPRAKGSPVHAYTSVEITNV
ncbi:kazrin, periplakin interacting protein b isoform X3 [Entelurus aequoreus]|uniref:kazrin, periplakin interacting protein b isoform X3 n=2 Tax=Entelurus aequoreus TaxID=161455 RepID=UPI002B1D110A|nr:kazrin, periplakin interacting protein b isoform X3 [Entelurus aequoreus]XP_061893850.1 kazrin, periplakin interacting protein b isoform X3 [Entelurus aequoreus]XP_061893851.1 kazrin, periplakin interacting protein b isoform X3 [Entelurus aequoreus]